jgi:hypothetical protein
MAKIEVTPNSTFSTYSKQIGQAFLSLVIAGKKVTLPVHFLVDFFSSPFMDSVYGQENASFEEDTN